MSLREQLDTIKATYALDGGRAALFELAEQAVERWEQVRHQLDDEGLMVEGRYERVKRLNPLAGLEAQARSAAIRAIHALRLDSAFPISNEGDLTSGID